MATGQRLVLPNQFAVDPTGVPYAGGQLFFYASGTSTPLDTYSDQGLTVPNTNPVVANASGLFGNVYLQNLAYKVVLEDSGGNQIWTMDPVEPGVSAAGGAFTGTVTIQQAAPASTSPLRADQAWQIIGTYTPSGVASQAIPLSSSFRAFRLTLLGMQVGTGSQSLGMQFSNDGGENYNATNYAYALVDTTAAGASTPAGTVIGTSISISASLPASSSGWDATLDIFPGGPGLRLAVRGKGFGVRDDSVYVLRDLGGTWDSTTGAMNYCRVLAGSGTITGTIILEGLP